ncbi:F0F1 ATP synthase subunit delta [Metabacillus arenae]|uniref:ATP synthase subunit delta n=1 Tax=Metabacillus arenae TaxID=2771434 RepID=A0A926NMQ3_9BACI|nr:F0F1 ATP synthase subunit delta [Metabacillus arenae]MBD1383473.1 F0F1 ATP synthase subunit delta [Metabacillus arenae]
MSREVVGKRYALALFQIAKEKQSLDQFEEDLLVVKEVFGQNRDFLEVLIHPKVTLEQKKFIVREAFSKLSPQILYTLLLLVERHRISVIADLADHFVQLSNEARGTEDATVYSVRPLKDEELSALSAVFAAKIGKRSLRLQNEIDKNLIGGVKLRIGNRIYDGSVSGKLERIERQLVTKRS